MDHPRQGQQSIWDICFMKLKGRNGGETPWRSGTSSAARNSTGSVQDTYSHHQQPVLASRRAAARGDGAVLRGAGAVPSVPAATGREPAELPSSAGKSRCPRALCGEGSEPAQRQCGGSQSHPRPALAGSVLCRPCPSKRQ